MTLFLLLPTPLTLKPKNIFIMEKVLKVVINGLALYAIGWILLWIVAVVCGAPANLVQWDGAARLISGVIVVPFISIGLVSIADELN